MPGLRRKWVLAARREPVLLRRVRGARTPEILTTGVEELQAARSWHPTRVHGLQYLLENLNVDDRLLLVDDVFNSGYSIEAVIAELQQKLRLNMPSDVRVATPYFKPCRNKTGRSPNYYVHEVDEWLVLPYELQGLSKDEIVRNKPSMAGILEQLER